MCFIRLVWKWWFLQKYLYFEMGEDFWPLRYNWQRSPPKKIEKITCIFFTGFRACWFLAKFTPHNSTSLHISGENVAKTLQIDSTNFQTCKLFVNDIAWLGLYEFPATWTITETLVVFSRNAYHLKHIHLKLPWIWVTFGHISPTSKFLKSRSPRTAIFIALPFGH